MVVFRIAFVIFCFCILALLFVLTTLAKASRYIYRDGDIYFVDSHCRDGNLRTSSTC